MGISTPACISKYPWVHPEPADVLPNGVTRGPGPILLRIFWNYIIKLGEFSCSFGDNRFMLSLTLIHALPGYSMPSFPGRISSSKPQNSWIRLCIVVTQVYQQKGKLNHSAPRNRVSQAARRSVAYTGITQYHGQYTQYVTLHQEKQ